MKVSKKLYTDIVSIVALALMSIPYIRQLETVMDVKLYDEAVYIYLRNYIFSQPKFEWGYLYSIWFKFLSFFTNHPVEIFYINYKIQLLLLPILFYTVLRSFKIHLSLALIVAAFFLHSSLLLITDPRISFFVLCVLFSAYFIYKKINNKEYKIYFMFLLAFLLAFARPEFKLSAFFILLYALYNNYERNNYISLLKKNNIICLILFICIWTIVSYSQNKYSTKVIGVDRDLLAFGQHYALQKGILNKNVYEAIKWDQIIKQDFPDCSSLGDIIVKYPLKVAKHILLNLLFYTLNLLMYLRDFFFPITSLIPKTAQLILSSITLLFVLFLAIRNWIRYKIKRFSAYMLIFSLPSLVVCFIIFPRPHYITLHLLSLVLFITVLLNKLSIFNNKIFNSVFAVIVITIVCFIIQQPYSEYDIREDLKVQNKNLPHKKSIQALSNLINENPKQQIYIYDNSIGVIGYVDTKKNVDEFSLHKDKFLDTTFGYYVNKYRFDYIYVDDNPLLNYRVNNDSTWHHFISFPQNYHYKLIYNKEDVKIYQTDK